MRKTSIRTGRVAAAIALAVCSTPPSAAAQSAPPPVAQAAPQVRRLTIDDAILGLLQLGDQFLRLLHVEH